MNPDVEAYKRDTDMVDGALETLELTLVERGIIRFTPTFIYFLDPPKAPMLQRFLRPFISKKMLHSYSYDIRG